MARYILKDADGVVVNMIALEDGAEYRPPQGMTLHCSDESAEIGKTVEEHLEERASERAAVEAALVLKKAGLPFQEEKPEPTIEEKLAAVGLTVEELKEAIGG